MTAEPSFQAKQTRLRKTNTACFLPFRFSIWNETHVCMCVFLCVLKVKRGQSEGQKDFRDERGGEREGTGIFVT